MYLFNQVPNNAAILWILKQYTLRPGPVSLFIGTSVLKVKLRASQHPGINVVTDNHSKMILTQVKRGAFWRGWIVTNHCIFIFYIEEDTKKKPKTKKQQKQTKKFHQMEHCGEGASKQIYSNSLLFYIWLERRKRKEKPEGQNRFN